MMTFHGRIRKTSSKKTNPRTWATNPRQTNSKSSTGNDAPPSPVFPRALNPKVDRSLREATPGSEASGKWTSKITYPTPENFERMLNVLSPQKGSISKEKDCLPTPIKLFKGNMLVFGWCRYLLEMNHLPTIDVNKGQLGEVQFIFPDESCRCFFWGRDLAYLKQEMSQQRGQK